MNGQAVVTIIGAPVACQGQVKDTWREMAQWAAEKLAPKFGDSVEVLYFDLFDPDCPAIPPNVQLPLILVDNQVLSSGGKISIPLIRKRLEEIGVTEKSAPIA